MSFLRRRGASSLAAVNTSFWNPAILGKVSRSAEFGCNQAYGVCTAGAPKRVEQGFWCTKSAKSAQGAPGFLDCARARRGFSMHIDSSSIRPAAPARAPDPARAQAPPVDALRWELKVLASAALR
jgi:hypothetical protein